MKMIVADRKDGRSCAVEEIDCTPGGDELRTIRVTDLVVSPPAIRPAGVGEYRDMGIPPGTMRWLRVQFQPGQLRPMDYTNTVDCHTVVAGSIELLLDDGPHRLEPGDSVIIKAVDHGWRIGPDGCATSAILFGL
jgi:hypothetical protein